MKTLKRIFLCGLIGHFDEWHGYSHVNICMRCGYVPYSNRGKNK